MLKSRSEIEPVVFWCREAGHIPKCMACQISVEITGLRWSTLGNWLRTQRLLPGIPVEGRPCLRRYSFLAICAITISRWEGPC